MKKFIIDKRLFNKYENLKVGIIICKDICNKVSKNDISNEMETVKKHIKEKFQDIEIKDYPVIKKWRDIYKDFGEKKSRSSVEALIRRIVNGNEIPSINSLVDIYNLISLKYELPCGAEDLNFIESDIELTYADGKEKFISLGTTEIENPKVGEIVYKFDDTVICRNFNYRESDLTKITENTKNAIIVIESIIVDNKLQDALEELSELIKTNLGGTTKIAILNKENNESEL